MIRPFTCVCFLLACGSGLYLYQSKHRVQVLDREIERTVRATEELREQTRVLHAEWTLQNDPQRLQGLAEQFLTLKTVAPGQFTSLADLNDRIPAVKPPEPPPPEPKLVAVAEPPLPEQAPSVAPPQPTPPPKPAVVAAVAAPPPRPVEHKPAPPPPPRPVVAEVQPVRAAPVSVHPVMATQAPRPITVAAPVPMTGSSLGMARGTSPPPPQPMPVSASQWVNGGGGG
jgi:hypothetical protein